MSRTWLLITIIAVGMMIMSTGYEIYKSLTGQNVKFNKTVTQIQTSLNENVLDVYYASKDKIIIQTDNLSNK